MSSKAIFSKTDATFSPSFSLVFYKSEDNHASYVEIADFVKNKGVFHLAKGRPISITQAAEVGKSLSNGKDSFIASKGIMTKNVLWFKSGYHPDLIWFKEEGDYNALFAKRLKIPSGIMRYPKMIFCAHGENLSIYVVKTSKITMKTKLYMLPLPNISLNGTVCLGQVEVKSKFKFIEEIMESFEAYFFNSVFNTYNDEHLLKDKSNMNEFWKKVIKTKKFDYDNLREIKTFKDLIQR